MIISAKGIIDLFKDFGLSSATIQREKIDHAQVSLLFWINAGIGLALTILIAALAPLLVFVYHRPELLELTLVLSLTTFLGALSVQHQALLRRQLQFGTVGLIDTTAAVVSSGAAVFVGPTRATALALVIRQIAPMHPTVLRWNPLHVRPDPAARSNIRELLRFGSDISAAQLVNYLERNVDNILIARLFGPSARPLQKAYGLIRVPIDQITGCRTSPSLRSAACTAIPSATAVLSKRDQHRVSRHGSASGHCRLYSADWFNPCAARRAVARGVPAFQAGVTLLCDPLMASVGCCGCRKGVARGAPLALVGGVIAIASSPSAALGRRRGDELRHRRVCIRAPLKVYLAGPADPCAYATRSSGPARWTCSLRHRRGVPAVSRCSAGSPRSRTALSGLVALALGIGVGLAAPWSRHMPRTAARC